MPIYLLVLFYLAVFLFVCLGAFLLLLYIYKRDTNKKWSRIVAQLDELEKILERLYLIHDGLPIVIMDTNDLSTQQVSAYIKKLKNLLLQLIQKYPTHNTRPNPRIELTDAITALLLYTNLYNLEVQKFNCFYDEYLIKTLNHIVTRYKRLEYIEI